MAIITQTDIQGMIGLAKLIQLCDDEGTGEMDSAALAILDAVMTRAEGHVRACCSRYIIPASGPYPGHLIDLLTRQTVVYLLQRRPDPDSEFEKDLRERLEKELNKISDGDQNVDGLSPIQLAQAQPERSSGAAGVYSRNANTGKMGISGY
jgi:hypothetical protein